MPIRRFVKKGAVFTPQAISTMNKALEATTEILGVAGDEEKRQAVAKLIIRLAQEDSSLDAAALRDTTVAALGGVEYLAALA
jgi:hypothetical protein